MPAANLFPACFQPDRWLLLPLDWGWGEINSFSLISVDCSPFHVPPLPSILNIFQAAPELTPVTHRLHAITAMGHTITHSDLVQHTT